MVTRAILAHHYRPCGRSLLTPCYGIRYLATQKSHRIPNAKPPRSQNSSASKPPAVLPSSGQPKTFGSDSPQPLARQKSWLTRRVESSPTALSLFLKVASGLGYGSPKQLAGRKAFVLYEQVCAVKADDEKAFWQNECHLPPTFQSWFTVTNLHVWLLTVRLRALPKPLGTAHVQALIDHFFLDVEDRIRAVLQPPATPSEPYTFHSSFYTNPNAPNPTTTPDGKPKPRSRAPDRLVTKQMKIFKEQWAGMGMAFDLGLVKDDVEMAGAVWRNLLGARGARGIALPDPVSASTAPHFRRSVNLVGGEVVNVSKVDLEKEELRDDGSGVHDFGPSDADKYVAYPELMLDMVHYVRKELVRLEGVSDEDVMAANVEQLRFGKVVEGRSVKATGPGTTGANQMKV